MYPEERRIYFALLTVGIIVLALVVVFVNAIVRYQRRKVYAYRLTLQEEMKVQEAERSRIAAEIHDDISSALSVVKLRLSALHPPDERDRQIINDTLSYIDKLSDRLRNVSNQLLPVILERQGLQTALEELISPLVTSPQYRVTCRFVFESSALLPEASIHIYRMFQEIINNIIRHSQASRVSALITEDENILHIEVKDNGKGFNSSKTQTGNGLGLQNIRMRADILQAKFYLEAKEGRGVHYTFEIPKLTIRKTE